MIDRVFVMGAGRAGRGLARALRLGGADVVGLHGRTLRPGDEGVSVGRLPPALATATVVLVTVRDAQLEDALDELAAAAPASGAVVLHASGSARPTGLARLRERGNPCGTFHPLVPLSDSAQAAEVLRGAWIGVDGDPEAVAASGRLAAWIGARVLEIPEGAKIRYHAAAVFASNFPIVLAAIAERLLNEAGVPDESARPAIRHLLLAAVSNLRTGSPAERLTGPIARGDHETVRRHVDALAGERELRDAYVALSRIAVRLAREGGTDDARLAKIETLMREVELDERVSDRP